MSVRQRFLTGLFEVSLEMFNFYFSDRKSTFQIKDAIYLFAAVDNFIM